MVEHRCLAGKHLPRVFLALLFVIGGFNFLTGFEGTVKYVTMGLTPWGLAGLATVATVIAIVLKLGGGVMLLVNYRTSIAAWMLIVFTVLATVLYHLNWSGESGAMQMTQFLKNLAIIGGMMLFACCPCKECEGACKTDNSIPAAA